MVAFSSAEFLSSITTSGSPLTNSTTSGRQSVQALLAAQAADAIVGFLHRVHQQDRNALPKIRLEYDDNQDFNGYVDEANEQVQIFGLI